MQTEPEPLLLSGYEGLKQRQDRIPAAGRARLKEALERLVRLYEATDRTNEATEWKKKLVKLVLPQREKTNAPPEP